MKTASSFHNQNKPTLAYWDTKAYMFILIYQHCAVNVHIMIPKPVWISAYTPYTMWYFHSIACCIVLNTTKLLKVYRNITYDNVWKLKHFKTAHHFPCHYFPYSHIVFLIYSYLDYIMKQLYMSSPYVSGQLYRK